MGRAGYILRMKIATAKEMRILEEAVIAAGTPAAELMFRAGAAAAEEAQRFVQPLVGSGQARRWIVLAGKGQNGGDAYVAARILAQTKTLPVFVYSTVPRDELTGAALYHANLLPSSVPVRVAAALPPEALAPGGVVVDGMLGTGVSGALRPPYDRLVAQVAESGLPVVALDLPSGMDADSGEGACAPADLTVTMGLPKLGLFTAAGRPRAGIIRVADIGLPPVMVKSGEPEAVMEADVRRWLPRRPQDAHKNRFGHVLVLGGSAAYAGAPMLAGAAALRSGCGLVTVAVPAGAREVVHSPLQALITESVPEASAARIRVLHPLLERAQAVVCGPGAGRGAHSRALARTALRTPLPVVLDADGLRELARSPRMLVGRKVATLLTPHPGEMRALLDAFDLHAEQDADRVVQAERLACRTRCWVALKGQATVLASPDGRLALNSSGTCGLATAGSGDVLAGMLGGLLAQGLAPWEALCAGVFLHGRAAELAPCGGRALVADDLFSLIGPAFASVSPFP